MGFWNDFWCKGGPLKVRFPSLFQISSNKEARVADYLSIIGDCVSWNPLFIRDFHDWELEEVHLFLVTIYMVRINTGQTDTIAWNPSKRRSFEVKSYYQLLSATTKECFPWNSIWKSKAPPRVAFSSG